MIVIPCMMDVGMCGMVVAYFVLVFYKSPAVTVDFCCGDSNWVV